MKFNDSVIILISGTGYANNRMKLGEIGDILHISNFHKLLAFAGLDHSIKQSSTSILATLQCP